MKTWLVLLLVAFALIAGYKFSGYQHQLSESNADKERLTNVLARSRATETSELKVIKPAAKLISNESEENLTQANAVDTRPVQFLNDDGAAPVMLYSETEGSLNTFFALSPNNERFILDSVKCENGRCLITGEYDGSESELSLMIEALEQEPWWQFGPPVVTTQVAQRGLKLNVSFATPSHPTARIRDNSEVQTNAKQEVASAG
ncbi:hypothetical protein [Alteromonas gracilis]|uniref:hypothetical protein n=1 Tax=Alteromonas gracilis TaxID=1479524 RepID=UPI003736D55A